MSFDLFFKCYAEMPRNDFSLSVFGGPETEVEFFNGFAADQGHDVTVTLAMNS